MTDTIKTSVENLIATVKKNDDSCVVTPVVVRTALLGIINEHAKQHVTTVVRLPTQ